MSVPVGKLVYTQWLNERGGIEADLTVTREAANKYMVVTAAATQVRDFQWLKDHIPAGAKATLTDVTSGMAVLSIMGPNSRALLQSLTHTDMSNEAFPFGTSQIIDLGYARVRASRVTFVGELGWELYIATEYATGVFDAIVAAGAPFGLKHAGYHALNSLRMEKGYRDYGHDIDNTDSPLEVGLGFTIDWDKDFVGRQGVTAVKESGPLMRRLAQVRILDPEPLMFHGEVVYRDGVPVGYIRAASYGHTLGGAVGLAMIETGEPVTPDVINSGTWEVDVAGVRYPAVASLRPMYDPDNARIKA